MGVSRSQTAVLGSAAALAIVMPILVTRAIASSAPASAVRVKIFVPRGNPGIRCDRVVPLWRMVQPPAVLTGAMRALLRGPTTAERRRGYGGWFNARTTRMLTSVRVAEGIAFVDFTDFSRIISNASTSCGSALLLAQLDRTAKQFPTVRKTVYSFNASVRAFYEWLQLDPPRR